MQQPPEPCRPHSECWCEQHPNNPHCATALPIDSYLWVLFLIAIFYTWAKTKNLYKNMSLYDK